MIASHGGAGRSTLLIGVLSGIAVAGWIALVVAPWIFDTDNRWAASVGRIALGVAVTATIGALLARVAARVAVWMVAMIRQAWAAGRASGRASALAEADTISFDKLPRRELTENERRALERKVYWRAYEAAMADLGGVQGEIVRPTDTDGWGVRTS